MFSIFASVIDGILTGAVYGLAAMGLTLVWGAMRIINLAHGTMIALGMFALLLLGGAAGGMNYAMVPLVAALGLLSGMALYWIAIHRVARQAALMSLLATFAVNMILVGLGTVMWGTAVFNVEMSTPGLTWNGYTFPGTHVIAAVLAMAVAGLLYLFLYRTRVGKAVRAVAGNREAAALCGIPTTSILSLVVGLGGALAATSGALIATMLPFTILSGNEYLLKSFVVTVLGGLGNPAGALFGGLALGVLEGAITPFMPVSWVSVVEFGLFVAALIAFPAGLFNFRRR
jgi:branched-subunit amino acid ABC-type transport system permease component